MTRLHEVTPEQLEEWRQKRMEVGREKYGDAHLGRYNLVDVMEELLDALNILELTFERIEGVSEPDMRYADFRLGSIAQRIEVTARLLTEVDALFPDALCTDEQGGERIWWSEQGQ